jgi:hypothetical protein
MRLPDFEERHLFAQKRSLVGAKFFPLVALRCSACKAPLTGKKPYFTGV